MLSFKRLVLLVFAIKIERCLNVSWEKIKCSADRETYVPEGPVLNIGRFPWLGIIQHSFVMGGKTQFAITGAVLVHPAYAIAPAEDMAKILPEQLVNNTKLILWRSADIKYALEVRDYILHPQYHNKVTFATIALLELITWGETGLGDLEAPVLPICLPISGAGTYNELYAVKLTDASGEMAKEIMKMSFVDSKMCDEFYYNAQLMYEKVTPINPICAKSKIQQKACVWDSGVALITRQSWGYWKLLGFGLRGPGCGLTARFIRIHDYLPWINDVITAAQHREGEDPDTVKFVLRRLSPIKLVMYKADDRRILKQQGQCDRKERGGVLWKDNAEILCNKNFAQGFYFVSVTQIAAFLCAHITLEVNSRTNAAVWLEHNCHRDATGLAVGMDRPSSPQKQECFVYFKTAAFIEFRFFFSFKAIIEVTLYGKEEIPRVMPEPSKRTVFTTPWWPTPNGLRFGNFVPRNSWWYSI